MGTFSTLLYFELPAYFVWLIGTGDFLTHKATRGSAMALNQT